MSRERLDYEALHWGSRGSRGRELGAVASPKKGDLGESLGRLTGIVYRTKKGSDLEPIDYDHDFARPFPELVRHNASGRLIIAGGRYRVEARGIVENGTPSRVYAVPSPMARLVLLGDLVEVRLRPGGTRVPRGTPRLCYDPRTGLLVIVGGPRNAL